MTPSYECIDCGKVRQFWTGHPGLRCSGCYTKYQTDLQAEVDPIAVERLLAGHPPPRTTRAERMEAAFILISKGHTAKSAGQTIGVTRRTIERFKARSRSES